MHRKLFAGRRVLILEDDPIIGMDLISAFHDAGAQAWQASTVQNAVRIFYSKGIDAAVLDVQLGRNETCSIIAWLLKQRGVPFILVSGYLESMSPFIRELEAPALAKPANSDRVVEEVQCLFSGLWAGAFS